MANYIRKEILETTAYHLNSYPDALKLNQNEISTDIPGDIKAQVLEKIVRMPWNRYPLSQPFSLRDKLSRALNWPSEGILIANGSNVLIQAILLASAVNSKVLTVDPTFGLYEIEGRVLGNQVKMIRLGENFSFPLEAFLKDMTEAAPAAVFLANPNAPTGNQFPREAMVEVIKNAPCLVVIDEAYFQFADYHLLDELQNYKNLILLRTFSKAFGLGGVRMGYALTDPALAQEISKVLLPYCVSAMGEAVVEALLDHPELVETRVTETKIGRAWLYQTLSSLEGVKAYVSQTNFILFEVEDAARIFDGLLAEGVLIRNVSNPRSLRSALRVTVGTAQENEKFVKALEKVLKSLKAQS